MADADRVATFKAAAVVLSEDVKELAFKLRTNVRNGHYERAAGLAAQLQRTARDIKWLMQRQPRSQADD
jgi:hypothetical protein